MLSGITYTTYGKCEAHCVKHSGGDRAVMEGIADALVITEKAPLIRFDFTQVKRRKREPSCRRKRVNKGLTTQSKGLPTNQTRGSTPSVDAWRST